jgi:hypothetical protein
MKTILLLLATSLPPLPSLASDGLIRVPTDAVRKEQPRGGERLNILNYGLHEPDAPRSSNVEDYLRWVKAKLLAEQKSAMATRTLAHPLQSSPPSRVSCLPFHDAFGFERVNDSEFKLNCFAGTERSITHVLDYQMRVTHSPANCASDSRIREFFNVPSNRNPAAASSFWRSMAASCHILVDQVNAARPIVRSVAVNQDFVNKVLENREDLRLYVNRSRDRKTDDGRARGTFTNPLRSGSRPAN